MIQTDDKRNSQAGSDHSNLRRDLMILILVLSISAVGYTGYYMMKNTATVSASAFTPSTAGLQGIDNIAQLTETGNHLMDAQRFPEAISHYSRVLELDSSLVDVRVDRGSCYFAADQLGEALVDFEFALALQPEHAIARFNLGIVHGGLGNDSLMLYYWNEYLEIAPDGDLADRVRNFLDEHSQQPVDSAGE